MNQPTDHGAESTNDPGQRRGNDAAPREKIRTGAQVAAAAASVVASALTTWRALRGQ